MNLSQPMVRAALLSLVGALAAALGVSTARAVSTRHFTLDDAADFEAGELEGAMVLSNGELRAGPALEKLALPDTALAASLARAPDGTLYVGTGSAGRIFRLRGGQLAPFAETGQLLVASMVVAPDGTLYAGTLPEGRVYRIDAAGTVRELVRLEEAEHVWALAYDAARQRLYAATGPRGRIYRIAPSGQAELVFAAETSHVMSLALDGDGTLYAGTDGAARVLRVTPAGRVEVVASLPGNEVTALAVRAGSLAVVANEMPSPPRSATKALAPATDTAAQRPPAGKGRVYVIGADGRVDRVLARDTGHFTSVAFAADGGIVVGGGSEGRVYGVFPDRSTGTLAEVDARQVLAIDVDGDRVVLAAGDPAALYHTPSPRSAPATWTSKVLDAGFRARFGQVVWRGTGRVEVSTRSGNTERPDATWSAWSESLTSPGPVRSAEGRFVQVRVRFGPDANAAVRSLELYYLPQNQRAVVRDVGLGAAATKGADGPPGTPTPSTKLALSWSVDNPDRDALRFRLRFRAEGRERFLPVFGEEVELTETSYTWDTTSVPDGWYVVEVEASDERANPEASVLRHRASSPPILIDNHAPDVEALNVQTGRVVGRALDAIGPIARLELSLDGGPFRDIHPEDGLLDSAREAFSVGLPAGAPPPQLVAVRATDAAGNARTVDREIRARRP